MKSVKNKNKIKNKTIKQIQIKTKRKRTNKNKKKLGGNVYRPGWIFTFYKNNILLPFMITKY